MICNKTACSCVDRNKPRSLIKLLEMPNRLFTKPCIDQRTHLIPSPFTLYTPAFGVWRYNHSNSFVIPNGLIN